MLRTIYILILITTLSLNVHAQQSIEQLRETAQTFLRQGDYSNAVLVLNKALQQKPDDLETLRDMAYTHYLQRDFVKALERIKPLLDREDADVRTFQVGGNIFKALEEIKDCDRMYKKAIRKYPSSGALRSEYGELLWARKEPQAAINEWKTGIREDPSHSGNYYHAAKYYFALADKVWSLIYAEIFINLESYSTRTAEIKTLLLESYKKFFTQSDVFKQYNAAKKTAFESAILETLSKSQDPATTGITTEKLTMIRTRFILDWFETHAAKFPHRLFDQMQYLIREGMFESYNQWIFGAAADIILHQNWMSTHEEDYKKFTYFQRNRVFRMPGGQYYGE